MTTKASRSAAGVKTSEKSINGVKANGRTAAVFNKAEFERRLGMARERTQNAINLAFEKAVAHRENPSMYPLPANDRSVERAFHNFLESLPKGKRNKIVDRVSETLKASPATRSARYKDLVNVNFKSSTPIAQQIETMAVPEELRFNEAEGQELLKRLHLKADKKAVTERIGAKAGGRTVTDKPVPQQVAVSTKVSFIVDSMTCLNPDDVLKDEINLAGFSIDTNGNEVQLAPLFIGKFKKNDTLSLGANNKLFTLDIDPVNFPQSFTAGLFIIESDLVSDQDTVDKLSVLFIAIGVAIAIVALALMAVSAFVVPIVSVTMAYFLVALSGAFQAIGLQMIPLIGDDISLAVTDTLLVEDKIDIGESFARNLTIGKGFDINSTFDGKYTLAARWLGEA